MKDATRLVVGGRAPEEHHGAVNRPVYRASTILFPTLGDWQAQAKVDHADAVTYGVHGTPDTFAFEDALTQLGGGFRTRLCGTGLEACAAPLLCCLSAGDHLLLVETCYGPTRRFAQKMLTRLGIEVELYDPLIGGGIADLIRPNTRVIFAESPGSLTFEVQDIPAIAEAAHRAGALLMLDNTWASPLYFKAFEHGVDISIQALTKYVGGHADVLLGSVTTTEAAYPQIRDGWLELGLHGAPDEVFLAARGLRTLEVRMRHQWQSGLAVAEWLAARPEVAAVLHPALPGDPGHALWQRDFLGAASLFGFILKPELGGDERLAAFVDGLQLFGMGSSWGGYESLILPQRSRRSALRAEGQLMRIHIGLEAVDDLTADLAAGFARMTRI